MSKYTPEEITEIIEKYNKMLADKVPVTVGMAKEIRDASLGIKDYTNNMEASTAALKKATIGLGSKLLNGEQGLSVYNEITRAGLKTTGIWAEKMPVFGSALEKVAGGAEKAIPIINQQADTLFNSFKDMSRSGLVIGMEDTFKNLQSSGFTVREIAQYSKLMKENSQLLATFGGTTADGAKEFAEISSAITNSGLEKEFQNMGMSVADIADSTLKNLKFEQLRGSTKKQTMSELIDSTTHYIDEKDRLTKLTGMTAEQQNKALSHAYAQQQFSAKQAQLQRVVDAGGADAAQAQAEIDRNEEIYVTLSKYSQTLADDMSMVMAGAVNTPGFARAQKAAPELASKIAKGVTNTSELMSGAAKELHKTALSNAQTAIVGNADKYLGDYAGIVAFGAQQPEEVANAHKKAIEDREKAKKGLVDKTTPHMTEIQIAQRNATLNIDAITNEGITPVLTMYDALTTAGQQAFGIVGEVAGKKGQIGGGTTALQKAGISGPSGSAPAAIVGGQVVATPSTGTSPGGTSPGGTSSIFPGGTLPGGTGVTGSPIDNILATIRKRESSGNYQIKAKGSSASGAYQFIDSTWQSLTKKYGVGQGFSSAYLAPPEIQDQVARKYVEEILAKNNGDITAVPKTWYTGNAQGKISAKELALNRGITPDMYAQGWVNDLNKVNATASAVATAGNTPAIGTKLSGPTSGYNSSLTTTKLAISLPDGNKIPIQPADNTNDSSEQNHLMTLKIQKLDNLISSLQNQIRTTTKILQLQA